MLVIKDVHKPRLGVSQALYTSLLSILWVTGCLLTDSSPLPSSVFSMQLSTQTRGQGSTRCYQWADNPVENAEEGREPQSVRGQSCEGGGGGKCTVLAEHLRRLQTRPEAQLVPIFTRHESTPEATTSTEALALLITSKMLCSRHCDFLRTKINLCLINNKRTYLASL